MQTLVYLARHGETYWNKIKRFQGRLDSELTQAGELQVRELATELQDKNIDLVISSKQGRAVTSARIIQQQLDLKGLTVKNLAERDLGHWQGQYMTKLSSKTNYFEIFHQLTHLAPPNGESAIDCAQRMHQALFEITAASLTSKNILVICHGEALRCFISTLVAKSVGAKSASNNTGSAYELYKNACAVELEFHHNAPHFRLL